jgi:hypothetical protein
MNLEISNYKNLLNDISFSVVQIEETIINYKLNFDSYKNNEVEWKLRLPMFVYSFYKIIITDNKIPTQKELFDEYISNPQIVDLLSSRTDREEIQKGIKARLFRTYPSLIRDLHFAIYLKERIKNGGEVFYNTQLDIEIGIDVIIIFKSKLYALNLYTPTKRAINGREKKENRHETVSNVIQIELPVEFNQRKKVGEFFLYGENEFNKLKKIIKNTIK